MDRIATLRGGTRARIAAAGAALALGAGLLVGLPHAEAGFLGGRSESSPSEAAAGRTSRGTGPTANELTLPLLQTAGLSLALTPTTDTNPLLTSHTLTADVDPDTAGLSVRFRVSGGPNLGDSGSAVTDADGKGTFSYVGAGGAGTDAIVAWIDLDGDALLDADEPVAVATKTWTSASPSPTPSPTPGAGIDLDVPWEQVLAELATDPALDGDEVEKILAFIAEHGGGSFDRVRLTIDRDGRGNELKVKVALHDGSAEWEIEVEIGDGRASVSLERDDDDDDDDDDHDDRNRRGRDDD